MAVSQSFGVCAIGVMATAAAILPRSDRQNRTQGVFRELQIYNTSLERSLDIANDMRRSDIQMSRGATARFLEKHSVLVIFIFICLVFAFVVACAEIALRQFGTLNIHFYTGHTKPGLHVYPYGVVPINKDGHPDEEFVVKEGERRIGYFGDSVTYGVGAGYGYRTPDLLQASFPDYRHWVFAQVGVVPTIDDLEKEIVKYRLASVIYLMNLNDILPSENTPEHEHGNTIVGSLLASLAGAGVLGDLDAMLRGKSYVYTYMRLGLKNAMQRAGYEQLGIAYELRPKQYHKIVEDTAARVVSVVHSVSKLGPRMCVILLPYEMQISADAAAKYASLGFSWEEGFLQGSTQEMLKAVMRPAGINVFDGREAFADSHLKVGEAWVFDKGDKIDWNHPNRVGHARMARWLAGNPAFKAQCLPN